MQLITGFSLRGRRERGQVLLALGLCSNGCILAAMTLNFGLEKPVLVQVGQHAFVNNLATEVGKLENTEALSRKEAVIDDIKSKLRAAKRSYVPFSSLSEDSTVKALKSQLTGAKKQLADLMIKLARESSRDKVPAARCSSVLFYDQHTRIIA